jgi:multisubunit Na+/H+ antiporter MnhE subunit
VAATQTARPRTFLVGIFTGLFGLSLLFALVVIGHADVWWRWLLLLLPAIFAGLVAAEFRRSIQAPDEREPLR